jgi:hypothetical protein
MIAKIRMHSPADVFFSPTGKPAGRDNRNPEEARTEQSDRRRLGHRRRDSGDHDIAVASLEIGHQDLTLSKEPKPSPGPTPRLSLDRWIPRRHRCNLDRRGREIRLRRLPQQTLENPGDRRRWKTRHRHRLDYRSRPDYHCPRCHRRDQRQDVHTPVAGTPRLRPLGTSHRDHGDDSASIVISLSRRLRSDHGFAVGHRQRWHEITEIC